MSPFSPFAREVARLKSAQLAEAVAAEGAQSPLGTILEGRSSLSLSCPTSMVAAWEIKEVGQQRVMVSSLFLPSFLMVSLVLWRTRCVVISICNRRWGWYDQLIDEL
jgi:uncharacterized membrane protein YdbT with pleckstrin-like domain